MASPVTLLINTGTDFLAGAHAWRLWTKFGWHDMVARYRRSWIGPLWLILSAAIFIAALSLVYSTLFRMELSTYVPFVAVGVVIWGFISSVASESVNTFVESETYIRQVRANLFVYVLRVIWRNVLVFAHQFVVVLVVLALFATLELRMLPLAALGMFVLFLQALWITPLLGLIGTRFRDLQPIITNLLQVLFFITPVIWAPALLGSRRWIADMNPLTQPDRCGPWAASWQHADACKLCHRLGDDRCGIFADDADVWSVQIPCRLLVVRLPMARIELKNVDVDFPLLRSEHRSFKRLLSSPLQSSRFGSDSRQRPVLHALRHINLTLEHGARVVIIGANGAGKSTLLRVLAGIFPPVSGTVVIDGRVGALLTDRPRHA